MLKVLPDPKFVWKYMLAVTQIPRGSNQGDEMWCTASRELILFLKNVRIM